MKKPLLTLYFIGIVLSLIAGKGGPDGYGYLWIDSNEPGGPTYSWVDISQKGTLITGLGDDNFKGPYNIGFNFQYYWYTVSKFYVGSNGYISFGSGGNIAHPFPLIPSTSGINNYIAAMMTDLNFSGTGNPGKVYYWSNSDSLILTYEDAPFWDQVAGFSGANTFQIILSRLDSVITINYQKQIGTSSATSNIVTIGIENINGQMGLMHSNNIYPPSLYTIKFIPPNNPQVSIIDGSVQWNGNNDNGGSFLTKGGKPLNLISNIKNVGNDTISSYTVNSRVVNMSNASQVNNTANGPSMLPGADSTYSFTNSFSATVDGTYRYVTQLTGILNDVLPKNDSAVQELVVIDSLASSFSLDYNDKFNNVNGGTISWSDGTGGVAIYIKPPFYPIQLMSTKFKVSGTSSGTYAFYSKIYKDDGPNGSPGTLLDSVAVSPSAVNANGITTVKLSKCIDLTSGGIYVYWEMGGSGITLTTDTKMPISNRTYEVLSNTWSDFRYRESQDLFIGVNARVAGTEDVGVSKFVVPQNGQSINVAYAPRVYVKNFGNIAVSPGADFNISYKFGSGNVVTEPYSGVNLNGGDSAFFIFSTPFTLPTPGNYQLCAWASKQCDADLSNDTICINVTVTGINDLELIQHKVIVYPNPSEGIYNFEFAENISENVEIFISDIAGRIVKSCIFDNVFNNTVSQVDISELENGIYTFTILSKGKRTIGKISKIK